MKAAVIQSSYLPWKGYFDIIHDVDVFVFYDDVQYSAGGWRNRNRIKTAAGTRWLTIPVGRNTGRRICDVELRDPRWQHSHWRRWIANYRSAPFFERYRPFLEELYLSRQWPTLSELNQTLVRTIARDLLGIRARFVDSRSLAAVGSGQARLLDLLAKLGADVYVSGPAAKAYIQPEAFAARDIQLIWKDYAGYPEYPQLHSPFDHAVTVLDLLLCVGDRAPWYIWGWRAGSGAG